MSHAARTLGGMRITKLEHSCLIVEDGGDTLVIDPGSFTRPVDADGVVAVVITHEHPDHWTPDQLRGILDRNPEAVVFGPAGVVASASDFDVIEVNAGDTKDVGAFALQFFGGRHAEIHRSIPIVDNVGVLVNGTLYHPGDSYAVPDGVEVGVLAAPVGAPWLKIGEAMDFVDAVAPKQAFGIHEQTLSDAGRGMSDQRLGAIVEQHDGTYIPMMAGDSIEV